MATQLNPYKQRAMERKARIFAEHLHHYGIQAAEVDMIGDAYWPQLAEATGQKPPSPETIQEIKRFLVFLERPRMTTAQALARIPE